MNPATTQRKASRSGFSMTEMVVCISILGVMASIAIISMSEMTTSGKNVIAVQRMEMLNNGLLRMANSGRGISSPAQLTSSIDEELIVMTLQMRDEGLVGSPFVLPTYRPKSSSSTQDYRLRFNGVRFELLTPPLPGIGLKIDFDGSETGPARTFPPNFRPY
jgi:prepilin-type N-terminal cleavage/methylation domain-containing protein